MARFYLSGSNSRGGTVTAQGRNDGQNCWLRGWRSGVKVVASGDANRDWFDIYLTGGSNDGNSKLIGSVIEGEHGPEFQAAT